MASPGTMNRMSHATRVLVILMILGGLGAVIYFIGLPMKERWDLNALVMQMEEEGTDEAFFRAKPAILPGEAGEQFIAKGEKSIPFLIPILENTEEKTRAKAWYAFVEITGRDDFFYDPLSRQGYRDEGMYEIKQWWAKEQIRMSGEPVPEGPVDISKKAVRHKDPKMAGIALMTGYVIFTIGYLWMIIGAMKKSIWWGFGILLTPVLLIYVIQDFEDVKWPLGLWVIAFFCYLSATFWL